MQIKHYTQEEVRTITPEELEAVRESGQGVSWIDLTLPSDVCVSLMRDTFQFHELTIEDVLNQKQRPKTEEFPDYLFLILNPASYAGGEVVTRELNVFVGEGYLITAHYGVDPVIEAAQKRILPERVAFEISATYLLYALLDTIVDEYLPIIESIENAIDALEARLLQKPSREMQRELFQLKQDINALWWVVGPQKDIISALINHERVFIEQKSRYYLRDVIDHLSRVTSVLQAEREGIASLTNLYVSSVSNQLNIAVNRLTIFTVIIGSLAVVTGFYGMNFEHTFPPFDAEWGVLFAILLMVIISVAVYILFYRRIDP